MSGLVRSLSRDLAVNLGRLLPDRIPTVEFDSDAISYFDAVEAAGGSFDLTAVDPTYTDSYVKDAHNNFYAGIKNDGLWDKLTEFYFFVGKTFDGITVKGKGTGSLTNNNFISSDLIVAGTGAGLKGNGINKNIGTSLFGIVQIPISIGFYRTTTELTNFAAGMGVATQNPNFTDLILGQITSGTRYLISNTAPITAGNEQPAFIIGTSRSSSDHEFYRNGASLASSTQTVSVLTRNVQLNVFSARQSGEALTFSNSAQTFAFLGTGLTDNDAANLSTRVNTLMTALGCNVY